MIIRWFSGEQTHNHTQFNTEFHGGNRSLSSLWELFHPDMRSSPVPVPETVGRYCQNTSHRCTRNDRSPCSTAGSELSGRTAGR